MQSATSDCWFMQTLARKKEFPSLALGKYWYKNNCQNFIIQPSDIDPSMSASALDAAKVNIPLLAIDPVR